MKMKMIQSQEVEDALADDLNAEACLGFVPTFARITEETAMIEIDSDIRTETLLKLADLMFHLDKVYGELRGEIDDVMQGLMMDLRKDDEDSDE